MTSDKFTRLSLVLALACVPLGASAQPFQDAELYTAPVGVASASGGPTPEGEVSILREQFFEAVAPDMTGSGVALTPADTDRDGLFSQSIFVRSGPVVDNSRDPETEAALVFPAGVTVIGVVLSTGTLAATDTTWGMAPGVDYTASARATEVSGVEYARIVAGPGGSTLVEFRTQMNATPFTDEFRVLIDHGTAWIPNLVAGVAVVTGDDVNIGAVDGGSSSSGGYSARLPLTPFCFDSSAAGTDPGCMPPTQHCEDSGVASCVECTAMAHCDDGNECTADACAMNAC